jgi:predicted nucleic acid-binding protein
MIILDTNVLSEALKSPTAPEVLQWMAAHPSTEMFTTTVNMAEMLYGIALLPAGKRRTSLQFAADEVFEENFAGRVLPFDSDAARFFAEIAASRRALGRPIGQFDAQIAAIARSHGATLATRNIQDFAGCGIRVVNPWTGNEK